MDIQNELNERSGFKNLELLARQVVEGYISGMHKSPFHGFSAEFAEHKIFNQGESTRHIDWKLYAKTDKLYTKRYDDETNLRCHLIIDNSASMHYPQRKEQSLDVYNKIGFCALAAASIMNILKKQRDAVGLSIYSNQYDYYTPEKGSDRHHHMLLNRLSQLVSESSSTNPTDTIKYLHEIAQNIKRRSLVILFTDMFQDGAQQQQLFDSLRHLKYNKHDVVLFHVYDDRTERSFSFENEPTRFTDVETGEQLQLYPSQVRDAYTGLIEKYFTELKVRCGQYKINYVPIDIAQDFNVLLTTFLLERQRFM